MSGPSRSRLIPPCVVNVERTTHHGRDARAAHDPHSRDASSPITRTESVMLDRVPYAGRARMLLRTELYVTRRTPLALPGPDRPETRNPFQTIFEGRIDHACRDIADFNAVAGSTAINLDTHRVLADRARESLGWVMQELGDHWLQDGRDPNVGSEILERLLYSGPATILDVRVNMTAANALGRKFADRLLEHTYQWLHRQFGHAGIGGYVSHETKTTFKVGIPRHWDAAWVSNHFHEAVAEIMQATASGAYAHPKYKKFPLRMMVGHGWIETVGPRAGAQGDHFARRVQELDTRNLIERSLRMLAASTTYHERRWRDQCEHALGFASLTTPCNRLEPQEHPWNTLYAKSDSYIPKQRYLRPRDLSGLTEEDRVVEQLRRHLRPLHTFEWLHNASGTGTLDLYLLLTEHVAVGGSAEGFLAELQQRNVRITDLVGLSGEVSQVFYLAESAGRDRRLRDFYSLATPHQYKTFVAKLQREKVAFLAVIDIDHWQAFTKAHPGGDDDRYYHELVMCLRNAMMECGVVPVIALQGDTIVLGMRAADGETPLCATQVRLALRMAQHRVYQHFNRPTLHFQYEIKVDEGNGRYPAWGTMGHSVPALEPPSGLVPIRGPVTISAGYMAVTPELWGDAKPKSPHVERVRTLVEMIDDGVSIPKTASGLRKEVLVDMGTESVP